MRLCKNVRWRNMESVPPRGPGSPTRQPRWGGGCGWVQSADHSRRDHTWSVPELDVSVATTRPLPRGGTDLIIRTSRSINLTEHVSCRSQPSASQTLSSYWITDPTDKSVGYYHPSAKGGLIRLVSDALRLRRLMCGRSRPSKLDLLRGVAPITKDA